MDQKIVRETWLSKTLDSRALSTAGLATLSLILGSLIYWKNSFSAEAWMSASGHAVFDLHQAWRAWTTLFVHASAKHLLSNLFLFFIIGVFLSGYFGLLIFPLMTFLFGGLTNLIVLHEMPQDVQLIGASGMVFWMGGCWLVLYLFIDRRKSLGQRILRAAGVGILLFMPAEAFEANVSYLCHLVGFISGACFGLVFYIFNRSRFRASEVIEVEPDEGPSPVEETSPALELQ